MLRALLFCLALGLVLAPGASAEVRLIDVSTGAHRTLLRDGRPLVFADDASVVVKRRNRVLRVNVANRHVTRLRHLERELESIGPGGRSVELTRGADERAGIVLRDGSGRTIGVYDFGASYMDPEVAWSHDATRVAIAVAPLLRVIDLATGAIVFEHPVSEYLDMVEQAFSPDGSALAIADDERILRVDIPTGAATLLFRGHADRVPDVWWGEAGRIVVNDGGSVRLVDQPRVPVRTGADRLTRVAWILNGTALMFSYSGRLDDCHYPNEGLAALAPGQKRRVLVPPSGHAIAQVAESPDGRLLAVGLKPGEDRLTERRGKRRPWPKRIARDYGLFTRRGDAAVRRVVQRAARRLRRGASRHVTLIHVRNEFGAIDAPGAGDSAVAEALAGAIEEWLTAAGLPGIDALDDVAC